MSAAILLGMLGFAGCETTGNRHGDREESLAAMERDMAAKSAAEALNEMDENLLHMADAGDIFEPGIRVEVSSIGILRPVSENLAGDEGYVPGMVRTALNNNFRKFARGYITVINIDAADEEALQAEVRRSLSGSDDELSLTSRIAARALMSGRIAKIADRLFNLDFNITDTETHEVLAAYNKNHSAIELTGGIAVNRVTEHFLRELGVRLNEAGRLSLLRNSNEAETALAKGRAAVNAGRGLEAMNYLYNAENFDATRQEATGSLVAVQTRNREDLGAGARRADFFERQDLWQSRLNEYNEFYRTHPPFELFYTPPVPENMRGSGDSRAYDLSFRIGLRWNQNQIEVMERVLEEYILEGLYQNSPEDIARWELKGLPDDSELFRGPGNFNFNLVINVENERGDLISSGPMVMNGSLYRYGGRIYADCTQKFDAKFSGIRYVREQITDQLYIRIVSINGIDIKTVGENGFTRVVQTGGKDLPPAQSSKLPKELLASKQREIDEDAKRKREAQAATAKQEQDAAKAAEKQRKRQEFLNNPLRKSRGGVAATGGLILGAEGAGIINLDLFWGASFLNFDLGIVFYPGIQTEHLMANYQSSNSSEKITSMALGLNGGLDFVLAGRNWLLNTGAGVTFFYSWISVDGSSKDEMDDDFWVPHLKLFFDWRLVGDLFLRAGYRMDIYPAEKFYSYYKSETQKTVFDKKLADNIFLGFSIY
jgi:hypothetical protein